MQQLDPSDEVLYECWWADGTPQHRRAAAEELERRLRAPVTAFCYRLLSTASATEDAALAANDVVQDAFFALYKKRRQFTTTLRGWLFATARNRCFELSGKRREFDPLPAGVAVAGPGPDGDCIGDEEKNALQECLDRLPSEEHRFIESCVCDGLTYEEAAEVVGWTLSASGYNYRFYKILETLRICLNNSGISY